MQPTHLKDGSLNVSMKQHEIVTNFSLWCISKWSVKQ